MKIFNGRQHIDLQNMGPFGGMFVPYNLPLYYRTGDADQAAVALERAQLVEEAQRRAEREQTTLQMVDHIRRAVEVEQVLQMTAEELAHAMGVPHVSIELNAQVFER